jgi:hypothetical protein
MARQARRPQRPAATPQERESQLTSLAYDLVERRLTDGTATAQETIFFLKAGSQREALEQQKIMQENMLLATRAEKMAQDTRMEQLLADALSAFRAYSGNDDGYDVLEEEHGGYPDL